jgi:hypothetical protein
MLAFRLILLEINMSRYTKLIGLTLLLSATIAAQAQIVRIAVNSSNNPWKLSSASSCLMFSSPSCGYTNSCVVEPGQTAAIYPCNNISETLVIFDRNNKANSYIYETTGKSAYIRHSGRTGSVVLNEPKNGDVIFQGDVW